MTQEPDVEAAKARLENAFQKSLKCNGKQVVRTRIVQTYSILNGGDIDKLKQIEDDMNRLCTCSDFEPMRAMPPDHS